MFAAAGLLAVAPACARVSDTDATASLKILSGSSLDADWYGDGALTLRKQLCITSTTGRYTVDISAPTALFGKDKSNALIEVRFQDETGLSQSKTLANLSELTFVGSSTTASGDCSSGTNASIEIYVPETVLLSQQSGHYFDQISLSVRPL